MLGRFRIGYYWIQFSDLERCRIPRVVNADSKMCGRSCFASHVSIQQGEFQFEFLPSDPVRFVPMDLCCVYRTICKAHCGDASQFSPPPFAIELLRPPAIANPAPRSDRLDCIDVAENLKVHGTGIREPCGSVGPTLVSPRKPPWRAAFAGNATRARSAAHRESGSG